MKERPNLILEVKVKMYYGLKTMTRKFRKYGQLETRVVYLQNMPTSYVKYKNEEDKDK